MKKLSILKTFLCITLSLSACSNPTDNLKNNEIKKINISINLANSITGIVDFGSKFNIKVAPDILAKGATVSLIYPHDHPTLANVTIATGLTDNTGKFIINTQNFSPKTNDIYVLEAIRVLGDKANQPVSMRTYIKRKSDGTWESITGNNIIINKDTTSIVILSGPDSGITTESVIGKIVYNNNVKQINNLSSDITSDKVITLSGIVEKAIDSDRDPLSSIIKNASDFFLDSNNKSDIPSYVNTKFQEAKTRYGNLLGNSTSQIIRTESKTGYKQLFENGETKGILIYKDGSSQAYWVHGAIFETYISLGGTFSLGYPTTDELEGLKSSKTGHESVYQMFDGSSKPSLQYNKNTEKTFLLNKGIRDFWVNNQATLGLPTGSEVTNPIRQNFEGSTVFYNNGNTSTTNADTSSKEITSSHIQTFLEMFNGSLKEKDLFKQTPLKNITKTYEDWNVDYKGQARSADPNNFYQRDTGIETPILKTSAVLHDLSPAEIIYYAAKENNISPLILLAKLQGEQSLIEKDKHTEIPLSGTSWKENFEERLYKACGYGINSNSSEKNTGFYPQLVALSYQFALGKDKKSFDKAYLSYTPHQSSLDQFKVLYKDYAQKMSVISGMTIQGQPTLSGGHEYFTSGTVSQIKSSECVSFPVGNPAGTKIGYKNDSDYNNNYNGKYHMADDLNGVGGGNTDLGDPVYVIADGEVIEAKDFQGVQGGWGNIVFVLHIIKGREYVSMYAHLKDILVKKGQKITRKTKIGTIGRGPGNMYLAHLHFELRDVEGISNSQRIWAGNAYSKFKWDENKKWTQGQIRALTADDGSGNIGFINKNLCSN